MNRENVEKLRDFLRDEVSDERFDMTDYLTADDIREELYKQSVGAALKSCGTAACIGGWAQFLFAPRRKWKYDISRNVLGLDEDQATELFVPIDIDMNLSEIPRARAVATLTRLLETGEVDWGSE